MLYYNMRYFNDERNIIASIIVSTNIVSVFSIILLFIFSIPYFKVENFIIINLIHVIYILLCISLIFCLYYKIKFT